MLQPEGLPPQVKHNRHPAVEDAPQPARKDEDLVERTPKCLGMRLNDDINYWIQLAPNLIRPSVNNGKSAR